MGLKAIRSDRNKQVLGIIKLLWKLKRAKPDQQEFLFYQVCDAFIDMGGVYVKFMQGSLLNVMRIKGWHKHKNYRVYENMPVEPVDIKSLLLSELGSQATSFASIATEPFAAGSFGQVYRAKHVDGTELVVKVLRPSIKTLRSDMRNLRILSHALGNAFTSWELDVNSLGKQFIKTTFQETDYITEAKNALTMYMHYKDDSLLYIPKTYAELCSPKLIVQEYVDGISGTTLLQVHDQGMDVQEYVATKTGTDFKALMKNYIVHANFDGLHGKPIYGDFHPGNVRILPGNKLAFIDFGILASSGKRLNAIYLLSRQYWKAEGAKNPDLSGLFASIIRFYSPKIFHSLRLLYEEKTSKKFLPTFEHFIKANLTNDISQSEIEYAVKQVNIGQLLGEKINRSNRLGLKAKVDDISWSRNWQQLSAFLTKLGYRSVFSDAYAELYTHAQEYFPDMKDEEDYTMTMAEAYEVLSDWLAKVAQNDFMLFQKLRSELDIL